jgi:hypothetical protein
MALYLQAILRWGELRAEIGLSSGALADLLLYIEQPVLNFEHRPLLTHELHSAQKYDGLSAGEGLRPEEKEGFRRGATKADRTS